MSSDSAMGLMFVSFFAGNICMIVLLVLLGSTYEDGQVDCASGNMHYELVAHSDSTRTWEAIGHE